MSEYLVVLFCTDTLVTACISIYSIFQLSAVLRSGKIKKKIGRSQCMVFLNEHKIIIFNFFVFP